MSEPIQKLSKNKKTRQWYIDNVEAACNMTRQDSNLLNTWRNQIENHNLSIGILDVHKVGRELDFQNQGMSSYPVKLKHLGIGNAKLNVLLGDYFSRPLDFKCVISAKDEDSIGRKEDDLMKQLINKVSIVVKMQYDMGKIDQEALQVEMEKINQWATYDYQDIAEITANKILKYEIIKNDIRYTLSMGFKDLLVRGKVAFLIDDYNGDIKLIKLDPNSVTALGGGTNFIHEKDKIIIEEYKSVGQIYDDYYDELSEEDRKKLEDRVTAVDIHYERPNVFKGDILTTDTYGNIFPLNDSSNEEMNRSSDIFPLVQGGGGVLFKKPYSTNNGEYLVTTVFWKSRRLIYEVTSLDEFGNEQIDFLGEAYSPDIFKGETVRKFWVNEWCRATKIAEDIYVRLEPVKASAKSLTNLSTGIPPVVGVEVDYSMFDSIKELDLEYDKAFWKRSMLISQMQGSKTGVNASMIPNGWKPNEWLHMANIDQILLLDPTQEILNGPMANKIAAQATNTFVTQEVRLGANHEHIQALSDYMMNIEYTMGKICGVNGTREGEIGERQAVRNTQFEITQFSKITEHWFQLYDQLTKIILKKYLEVCKKVYKEYPVKGSYILSDLGQEFVKTYSEFAESEFDLHTNRPTEDRELFEKLKAGVEQAIAQGSAQLEDLITVNSSGSIQAISQKLKANRNATMREQQQIEKQRAEQMERMEQSRLKEALEVRAHEKEMLNMELEAQYYKVDKDFEAKTMIGKGQIDLSNDRELDVSDIVLRTRAQNEIERSNKVKESLAKEKNDISRKKANTTSKK